MVVVAKVVLDDLVSLTNETSVIATINENNDLVTTAIDNSLSRYGTSPNAMEADLDMNGNNLLNLPAPSTDTEPVRVADMSAYIAQINGTSTLLPAAVTGDIDKIPRVASAGLLGYSNIGIDTSNNLRPETTDIGALGTSSLMWSDLFLALGSVINWNNGDVTLTHAANQLNFAGATSGYRYHAAVLPATSDAAALGSVTLMWADLFLASGAVINWSNGDLTLTHSADTLTLAGGNVALGGTLAVTGTTAHTGAVTLTGGVTGAVAATGNISTSGGSIGYSTGTGSTVTQATSKSTGVTINSLCGQITMNAASLAAGAEATFAVTNSQVTTTDVIILNIASGGTSNSYLAGVTFVGSGNFNITLTNLSGGALAEAVVLNFAVIKGVTS